jgi:signal transduction histidine kinase
VAETEHVVQFYEQDAFLLDEVAAYLGAALREGGACIVIATPEHRSGIAQRLRASGADLAGAGRDGRFVMLDAAETLARIMANGAPDRTRFVEVVGELVGRAARDGRRVRAFGEMVALLVDEGNPAAAVRLERLWNDLGQTHTFSLVCAYPMDRFGGGARAGLLHELCTAHSSVIPAESYTALPTPGERLRAITSLQQQAQSLAAEVEERTQVEAQLRLALAERDRLLEAEQAARERAETALRVRDEFLSIAAHELRTPLTSVVGQAQLLLRRYERGGQPQPEQVVQALGAIQGQGGRLSRLISQLLDVSRLEVGRLVLERRPTDLAQVVEEAVSAVRAWGKRLTIAVTTVLHRRPLEVTLDRLRIEQVLNNLLENAVKYGPEGGPIEVALAQAERVWAEVSVRDHGPGIPADKRGRLFERLFQAHADGHGSGLGLGLYISRQIVQQHGGLIWAEFPPDGGARFVVRLPLQLTAQE